MNSVKLMHSEMREIGPTIVMLFWVWYELSRTEIAEISDLSKFQKTDKWVYFWWKQDGKHLK